MRNPLNKFWFIGNKKAGGIPNKRQTWRVCQDYEIRDYSESAFGTYLQAKYSQQQGNKWTKYRPLQDTPDLFLRFAKLYEKEPSNESALNWARSYGLIGYTPDGYLGYQKPSTGGVSWDEFRWRLWIKGVQEEGALSVFWEEVRRAAGVLAMYEAALRGDNAWAKELLLEGSPFIGGRFWPHVAGQLPPPPEGGRMLEASLVDDLVQGDLGGNYVQYCLLTAAWTVEETVNDFCYHTLDLGPDRDDPAQVVDVWTFENLLGAMYLQMYWLMGSGGNTTHCEWCGRLISLKSPYPGAKKRPSHKRFCDSYCREKWHYHNVRKYTRRGEEPPNRHQP
jgi:hypothetical protein